jgi:hypothetical protein
MKMRRLSLGLLFGLFLVQGAAFAAGEDRIANEGTIGDKWMLADGTTLALAAYPAALASRGDDVCIALGYRIREDGTTSDFAVLKQWNSATKEDEPAEGYWQAFAQAGADAVAQWRFKPRPEVTIPRATYTVATIAFTGAHSQAGDFKNHCRISDLAALIQDRKSRNYMKGSVEKRDQERYNQSQRSSGAMVENPGMSGSSSTP